MSRKLSFPSSYRLKSRKKIEELFRSSESLISHPVLFKFLVENTETISPGPLVAFSIGRKNFSKAVDRNRIKRLLRESYRLHWKDQLETSAQPLQIQIMLIYLDKQILPFEEIQKAMIKGLKKLNLALKKNKAFV
ncbi:MAG: ribonuclease P protein component [Saprospiraceae bacterium]|nr:ribonuclease P protein component [Saprospiraceae bacterium]